MEEVCDANKKKTLDNEPALESGEDWGNYVHIPEPFLVADSSSVIQCRILSNSLPLRVNHFNLYSHIKIRSKF